MSNRKLKYVLVTPARNEQDYITHTLSSVVAQTVLPEKWVVVSDGSTDRTDEIVKEYAVRYPWIELLRRPQRQDRQFAAKAHAFNAGCALLGSLEYDIIGNLDADLSFDPDYFEFIASKFEADDKLGVCGTPWCEDASDRSKHTYSHSFAQLDHVSGACQMFRKACFDEIGGYVPIKGGAIDWVAVTTARMRGWKTWTFVEKTSFHHRQLGTGNHSPLMVRFKYGQKAYYMGGHPLWEVLRGFFQMRQSPRLLGGLYFQCGFLWALITRMPRPISAELIVFHQKEQMDRLREVVARRRHNSKKHSSVEFSDLVGASDLPSELLPQEKLSKNGKSRGV